MNKNFFVILITILLVFVFLFSFQFVLARHPGETGSGALHNPLGEEDPRIIIGNVIRASLGIIGSLTLAFFIIGGFFWITSAGNDEKVKRGKDIIIWSSFGLALIFFSYALVTFLLNALAGS